MCKHTYTRTFRMRWTVSHPSPRTRSISLQQKMVTKTAISYRTWGKELASSLRETVQRPVADYLCLAGWKVNGTWRRRKVIHPSFGAFFSLPLCVAISEEKWWTTRRRGKYRRWCCLLIRSEGTLRSNGSSVSIQLGTWLSGWSGSAVVAEGKIIGKICFQNCCG